MTDSRELMSTEPAPSGAALKRLRTLIVDEGLSRFRIKKFLSELPYVEVIGECEDGMEAVRVIRAETPDLVLLDIQMPRMGGFDLLSEVGSAGGPMFIFVTASDQFALRAFECNALDYLLKPFTRERLIQAVERSMLQLGRLRSGCTGRCRQGSRGPEDAGPSYMSRFEIKIRGRIRLVEAADVDWLGGASNYVEIHVGQKSYLIREKLSRLCELLDPAKFVRIHRSTIVNIERVTELVPLFNGDHALFLRDGTRLVLSRTNCDKFLSVLRGR